MLTLICLTKYSRLLNSRVGWNKRGGGKIQVNLINVVVGIDMLDGKFNIHVGWNKRVGEHKYGRINLTTDY